MAIVGNNVDSIAPGKQLFLAIGSHPDAILGTNRDENVVTY